METVATATTRAVLVRQFVTKHGRVDGRVQRPDKAGPCVGKAKRRPLTGLEVACLPIVDARHIDMPSSKPPAGSGAYCSHLIAYIHTPRRPSRQHMRATQRP